jgi:tetratricopeptide (TPR) repeat protein
MQHNLEASVPALQPSPTVSAPGGNGAGEFKISRGYIVAGIVTGALLSLAGLSLVIGVLKAGGQPLWGLAGLGLLLVGGCVLVLMKPLAALRIWVSAQGFVVASLGPGRAGRCFRIEGLQPAETWRKELMSSANHATAYWRRGLAFGAQGEYDRALAELDEAIRLDPQLAAAYHARAAVYAYKGQYDQAMADYAAARQIQAHVKAG